MWHAKSQAARDAGRLQIIGIVQEQHGERAELYKQWTQFDWPLLVDSYNLLRVPVVPILLGVDEHGVIRRKFNIGSNVDSQIKDFLEQQFRAPPQTRTSQVAHELMGEPAKMVENYERYLVRDPMDGWSHFRLGVAYRKRYDSDQRQADDFSQAVAHWSQALEIDPNNYIWRRRLQQYGPRLAKPYPFYDWIDGARQAIEARGETAVKLRVEPSGSEYAQPMRHLATTDSQPMEPLDPQGQILRDEGQWVQVENTVVPQSINAGQPARLYINLRPRGQAHWNNEVDDLYVWIELPAGWKTESQAFHFANPASELSREERSIEIEVTTPANLKSGSATLQAYALYYICEDINGTCLYRRQDIQIRVEIADSERLGGR